MTKTVPANLQAVYDTRAGIIAYGLRLTRTDGEVFGWTSADIDASIGGVDYVAAPGLDVQSWSTSAGLAVDNTEITVLADDALITRIDILAGVWNNAAFYLFRYNAEDPSDGVEPIGAGTLGELTPRRGAYVAELRGLQQYLQQPVGAVSTKTCRARFADWPQAVSDTVKCRLAHGDWTETGTVTGVTSRQVFQDTGRAEAADHFGEGILTWTSGNNDGQRAKVKLYAADGTFTLLLPMLRDVQVGDTYSVIAGCRKRLDEDCVARFGNAVNFQAEPHRPTLDAITAAPEVDAQ